MVFFIKLPKLFWIPTILIGEYVMVQLVWHRDEFPFDKLGPAGDCKVYNYQPDVKVFI